MRNDVFYVDEGAVYDLWVEADGQVVQIEGRRARVAYTSQEHALRVTGRVKRSQKVGAGYNVLGVRAVLTMDTGEGLVDLHGVLASNG